MKIDLKSQRFGLPDSLIVPIAARSISAIEEYVGEIEEMITGRNGRVNAMRILPHNWPVETEPAIPLWKHADKIKFEERLHPPKQLWVHVDYSRYRNAYIKLGMPEIPEDHVLDHIHNRKAIRLVDYSHPYLRLCPVSRSVNTSGGVNTGGEGMQREHLRTLESQHEAIQEAVREALNCEVIYADPMDLTKMLNIAPGVEILNGVRDMLKYFYQ